MKEALISPQLATLAGANGFDRFEEQDVMTMQDSGSFYPGITLSFLAKWFREKHNIHFIHKPFYDSVEKKITFVSDPINIITGRTARIARQDDFDVAFELGLIEAFELIPKEKTYD